VEVLEKENEGAGKGATEALQRTRQAAKWLHAQPERGQLREKEGQVPIEEREVLPRASQQKRDNVHRVVDALQYMQKP
jgi:hypothetical protein